MAFGVLTLGMLSKQHISKDGAHSSTGELLRVAEEAGFDALLRTDKSLAYQLLGKHFVTPLPQPSPIHRNHNSEIAQEYERFRTRVIQVC